MSLAFIGALPTAVVTYVIFAFLLGAVVEEDIKDISVVSRIVNVIDDIKIKVIKNKNI